MLISARRFGIRPMASGDSVLTYGPDRELHASARHDKQTAWLMTIPEIRGPSRPVLRKARGPAGPVGPATERVLAGFRREGRARGPGTGRGRPVGAGDRRGRQAPLRGVTSGFRAG